MKKVSISVLKVAVAIVLFTTSTMALSVIGISSVIEAKAAVSSQQVISYLNSKGYTVVSLSQPFNTRETADNWQAHTILNGVHYTTTVFVQGTQIIGNVDSNI
ncbi:MAG: hypothetical protein M3R27_12870 [Bacteroidota bacterium]|nr:hypothetical protein [Bacteroidota bacterium]